MDTMDDCFPIFPSSSTAHSLLPFQRGLSRFLLTNLFHLSTRPVLKLAITYCSTKEYYGEEDAPADILFPGHYLLSTTLPT